MTAISGTHNAATPPPPIRKGQQITGSLRVTLARELGQLYMAGASLRDLTEQTGRSYGFVHRLLDETGVRLRSHGGAREWNPVAAHQRTIRRPVHPLPEGLWAVARPLIASGRYGRRLNRGLDVQQVFAAVVHVLTTEAGWGSVPEAFEVTTHTAQGRCRIWSAGGLWQTLYDTVMSDATVSLALVARCAEIREAAAGRPALDRSRSPYRQQRHPEHRRGVSE